MRKAFIFMSVLFATLFVASCEKEKEGTGSFKFNATIENLDTDDNAKVNLVDEQWVYWEVGDNISLASDKSSSQVVATLTNTGGPNYPDFNGTFISELPWSSKYFLGLFPYSENNVITGSSESKDFSAQIELPAVQPLRNDITFARKVFPMVERGMRGYYTNDALLLGVESRTSSPVRLPRNPETLEHVDVPGLYPCGEGAGYAGGIVSSALDGINCAVAAGR